MKPLRSSLSLISVLILLVGCNRNKKPEMIEVKIIEYRVEYMDDVAGSVPTSILPDEMTLILHEHTALTRIEGFLGQFSLSYLADLKKRRVTTMLKLFDRNYYYEGEEGELPAGIRSFDNMRIEETGDSAKVLDFLCRKYILHADDIESKDLWSTREIEIKNPNIATPYHEIPGVLLQFYSELSVLKMLLTIEKYKEQTISSDKLLVPGNYKKISKSAMEKTLEELFK